jgi:folylpolyglutamate synthase/dihydropteroate synthase
LCNNTSNNVSEDNNCTTLCIVHTEYKQQKAHATRGIHSREPSTHLLVLLERMQVAAALLALLLVHALQLRQVAVLALVLGLQRLKCKGEAQRLSATIIGNAQLNKCVIPKYRQSR